MQEQYTSYTAIELAADPAFIRWVQAGHEDSSWKVWIESYPDVRVKADQARQIVLRVSQVNPYALSGQEKKELWDKIASGQHTSVPAGTSANRFRIIVRWSIAAAAAIALLFWFTGRNTSTTIYAQSGEQKEITLPENSTVHLNAGTSVSFSKKEFSTERRIQLDGEAFFSVQPGNRFTVMTDQGSVTVLGTSFNVIARQDRFEVSCYTGKVMVENNSASPQTLMPGNRCVTVPETNTLALSTFSATSDKPEWTTGKFVFSNQPLQVVADELERQYNIEVTLGPGLEDIAYTGFFESGDLETALTLITWPLHLKADVKNNTVSIVR